MSPPSVTGPPSAPTDKVSLVRCGAPVYVAVLRGEGAELRHDTLPTRALIAVGCADVGALVVRLVTAKVFRLV